jgi:Ni/Co efflux regulator RcnB
MKKLLTALGAVALATTAIASTPAVAADNNRQEQRYQQRHDNGKHRGHYKRWHDPRYYDNAWDRRYRGQSYYHWRYFSRYPSYYQGYYCPRRTHVVVRDPYTYRYVCMPRYDFDRYRLEIRINL